MVPPASAPCWGSIEDTDFLFWNMKSYLFMVHSDPMVADISLHASKYWPVKVTMVPPASGPSWGSMDEIKGFWNLKIKTMLPLHFYMVYFCLFCEPTQAQPTNCILSCCFNYLSFTFIGLTTVFSGWYHFHLSLLELIFIWMYLMSQMWYDQAGSVVCRQYFF